jgi:uncharacterized protein (DUF1800 family)
MNSLPAPHRAAIAAHRFGLGEPQLSAVGNDAVAWLMAQIGPAAPQRGDDLASGVEGLRRYAMFVERVRQQRLPAAGSGASMEAQAINPSMSATEVAAAAAAQDPLRQTVQADVRARLSTAATSAAPFNERLALFWANHFTVSAAKNSARGISGAFEREALRPNISGRFETLLKASSHHGGMLRYLDNDNSAGADSAIVRRLARRSRTAEERAPRVSGLNENLAREILELHTLGVAGGGTAYGGWGGYTQADVTEFAKVLTGWRVPLREMVGDSATAPAATSRFDPAWHEPGSKTVLGRRYAEGPEALDAVLADLARHPSTARFVSVRLARHFVADDPPPALVARLESAWKRSDGDLAQLYRTLVEAPEAWAPQPTKLKTPEEFVISTARVLGLGEQAFARQPDAGIVVLGQRVQGAPSPAGWPDRAEDWLGPDAVWKRVEWATRVADRAGRRIDARALAQASLGPMLSSDTALQIERAADGPQALALLLLAPEFQRR